jgi:hypothetical protein
VCVCVWLMVGWLHQCQEQRLLPQNRKIAREWLRDLVRVSRVRVLSAGIDCRSSGGQGAPRDSHKARARCSPRSAAVRAGRTVLAGRLRHSFSLRSIKSRERKREKKAADAQAFSPSQKGNEEDGSESDLSDETDVPPSQSTGPTPSAPEPSNRQVRP